MGKSEAESESRWRADGEAATHINPAIPHAAEGFGRFDFAQSETRASQLFYAKDEWADVKDTDGKEAFAADDVHGPAGDPETWYRTQDRSLPDNIEQYVLNWLVINDDMKDWDSGIARSLETLVAKGTKKMSQSALAERTARQDETQIRTGESPSMIRWAAAIDMGDVWAQQLTIGGLGFTVLDYGDQLHMPMRLRAMLNDGNDFEKNQ